MGTQPQEAPYPWEGQGADAGESCEVVPEVYFAQKHYSHRDTHLQPVSSLSPSKVGRCGHQHLRMHSALCATVCARCGVHGAPVQRCGAAVCSPGPTAHRGFRARAEHHRRQHPQHSAGLWGYLLRQLSPLLLSRLCFPLAEGTAVAPRITPGPGALCSSWDRTQCGSWSCLVPAGDPPSLCRRRNPGRWGPAGEQSCWSPHPSANPSGVAACPHPQKLYCCTEPHHEGLGIFLLLPLSLQHQRSPFALRVGACTRVSSQRCHPQCHSSFPTQRPRPNICKKTAGADGVHPPTSPHWGCKATTPGAEPPEWKSAKGGPGLSSSMQALQSKLL